MCLIVLAWKTHPDFPLVVVANRDEYFERPTAAAHWWPEPKRLLAGRDEEAGGSWLGVSADGRFAALTNYRDPSRLSPEGKRSRGELVVDALTRPALPAWLDGLDADADRYNPFNLMVGTKDELFVFESVSRHLRSLTPGIHGVSNHLLNTPWPKLQAARRQLEAALASPLSPERLVELLRNDQPYPDDQLPDTGVPLAWERALSSCFIRAPGYGTRSTSVVMADRHGRIDFMEQTWDTSGHAVGQVRERFTVSPGS